MATSTYEEVYDLQYALQLASASTLPMVFKAATELGVLDIIEKAGPGSLLSASQIASQLPADQNNPDAAIVLDRILCLLASHSILTCSLSTKNQDCLPQRLYGLAPVAKYFIKNQDGGSLGPMLTMIQDKVMMDMWYYLKDAVLEGGILFDKAHGISAMEYAKKDARFGELFGVSMRSFNSIFMERLLKIYDGFQGVKCLVDVGGGSGSILNMIISKYPAIKGINYDLAPVIESSPTYPGIEHVAGDALIRVPRGDAIFMKWVTHNWTDENVIKLFKNCYEALPADNGKGIIVDMVAPEIPETSIEGKSKVQNHLYLASINPQGKERTEKEFERLAKAAGFTRIRVACSVCYFSVVEMIKSN